MTKWVTSDLHFSHNNVIEYCDRPYKNIEEMNEAIIKQWNLQVKPEDIVYVIGDFGINPNAVLDKNLVSRLNGKLYLAPGNHDFGFKDIMSKPDYSDIRKKYEDAGWQGVYPELEIVGNKYTFSAAHLPLDNNEDSRYAGFKRKNYDETKKYLCGHLHGHFLKKGNVIDVCFDSELRLRSLEEIESIVDDPRDFIPTRLTEKYKVNNLFLMPFEAEVKKGYVTKKTSENLVLFDYTDKCTYDKAWNDVTVYARGIVFNKNTGEVVVAPFPKFWNYSELSNPQNETDPENEMSKTKQRLFDNVKNGMPYQVFNKEDGSLGLIYHHNGEWCVNTRGSFSSDQAIRGKEILKKYDMSRVNTNLTLLAEIVYPENKIVVDYKGEEKLVLLAANHKVKLVEVSRDYLEKTAEMTGMPIVEKFNYSIQEMEQLQKTLPKDQEGFVIRFDDGLRVKIKGEEYLKIHRLISQVIPLAFFDVMVEGKVKADFLKELPEEYRAEADKIVKTLEEKYIVLKYSIIAQFVNMYSTIEIDPDNIEKSIRKYIGLNISKYSHGAGFFAILDQNQKALDTYILKKIRPKGNVL